MKQTKMKHRCKVSPHLASIPALNREKRGVESLKVSEFEQGLVLECLKPPSTGKTSGSQ